MVSWFRSVESVHRYRAFSPNKTAADCRLLHNFTNNNFNSRNKPMNQFSQCGILTSLHCRKEQVGIHWGPGGVLPCHGGNWVSLGMPQIAPPILFDPSLGSPTCIKIITSFKFCVKIVNYQMIIHKMHSWQNIGSSMRERIWTVAGPDQHVGKHCFKFIMCSWIFKWWKIE